MMISLKSMDCAAMDLLGMNMGCWHGMDCRAWAVATIGCDAVGLLSMLSGLLAWGMHFGALDYWAQSVDCRAWERVAVSALGRSCLEAGLSLALCVCA
jgi:hypothetical protein